MKLVASLLISCQVVASFADVDSYPVSTASCAKASGGAALLQQVSAPYKVVVKHAFEETAREFAEEQGVDVRWRKITEELCKEEDKSGWVEPGETTPLSEDGYRVVAMQHSPAEMETFVGRLMLGLDLAVTNNGSLHGFLPYYDCQKGAKNFDELRRELLEIASKNTTTWLKFTDIITNTTKKHQLSEVKRSKDTMLLVANSSEEFSKHDGFISSGGDLIRAHMTVEAAKRKCKDYNGTCKGFCFEGPPTEEVIEIIFKSKFDTTPETKWTSYKKSGGGIKGPPTFEKKNGFISDGGDLLRQAMTVEEAKKKCAEMTENVCKGFVHVGQPSDDVEVILFKNKWDNRVEPLWTSFSYNDAVVKGNESQENTTDMVDVDKEVSSQNKRPTAVKDDAVKDVQKQNQSKVSDGTEDRASAAQETPSVKAGSKEAMETRDVDKRVSADSTSATKGNTSVLKELEKKIQSTSATKETTSEELEKALQSTSAKKGTTSVAKELEKKVQKKVSGTEQIQNDADSAGSTKAKTDLTRGGKKNKKAETLEKLRKKVDSEIAADSKR